MPSSKPANIRCSTGIAGLDDILNGGLPKHRLYLVQGDPGVGKTTLATQFLRQGIAEGERCLYITLSETREELEAVADSHGWDLKDISLFELSALEDRLAADAQTTLLHPSEVELTETIRRLLEQVERIQPTRVVLDSLSEVRLLAQDPLRYRRQLLVLKTYFAGRHCTVLLLDDRTAEPTDLQVHSIAHGVIELEQLRPEYGSERRRLSIAKLRGSKFRGGYHDYIINTGGLEVFPRLVASEHHQPFVPGDASSGIPELDKLLGGGLGRGTSSLILGPAGTGKSTLALQYAHAAAERGEKSAIFAFDESRLTLLTRAKGLNINVQKSIDADLVKLRQIDPAELSPGEFSHIVRRAVEDDNARIIIIDSLNGYLNAMPEERFLTAQLHELFAYLSQRGVVTILVLAQHGLVGQMQNIVDLTYLADTVILLRYFEATGAVKKAIAVIKKRSGHHEETIREYRLQPGKGIFVGSPLTNFQGVLTGVPALTGNVPVLKEQANDPQPLEPFEQRVLVLTPTGADAQVAADLLKKSDILAEACSGLDDLLHRFAVGAGCLFIAQEALTPASIEQLSAVLHAQEPWSDIPVVLLSTKRLAVEAETGILHTLSEVGNILLVERPCRAGTLISVTRTALRARRRQYVTRRLLDERAKARDIAEQANLAKDRFLATLSHELRTPLTPVLATAGILIEDDRLPPDVRDDLDVIHRNVELEARLIDDLLDLTRVTKGKLQLNVETVDVHQLIHRVYDICCAEIQTKKIGVDFQLNAETAFVHADAARLHQMIWNLLKNAAKFTAENGHITISTRNCPSPPADHALLNGNSHPEKPLLIIDVKDSGIGLDPEQIPRLFTAFEQGSSDVTRQFGGLGLGLAITKALADAHAGRVTAYSDGPGKSATFSLELATVDTPAPRSPSVAPALPRPAASPLSILLLEDHADTARVMVRVLSSWGHVVHVVRTVAQARETARHDAFDLIISDIGLPDGTGCDFIQSVRAHSQTPAVALTGYGMEEDVKRCLAAGFQAHITKPVSFAKLESAIAELVSSPPANRAG